MTVQEIMRTPVVSIAPEAGLDRALVMMRTQRIRHLPVVQDGRLVGIVTDRDLRLSMVEKDGPQNAPKGLYLPALTKIKTIMVEDVKTITALDTVGDAANLMSKFKIGCLPVVEGSSKHVVGIVTETDMLRVLAQLLTEGKRKP